MGSTRIFQISKDILDVLEARNSIPSTAKTQQEQLHLPTLRSAPEVMEEFDDTAQVRNGPIELIA